MDFWNINQESLLIWKYTSDAIHHCIRMWPGHNVAEGIPFFLEAYSPGKNSYEMIFFFNEKYSQIFYTFDIY